MRRRKALREFMRATAVDEYEAEVYLSHHDHDLKTALLNFFGACVFLCVCVCERRRMRCIWRGWSFYAEELALFCSLMLLVKCRERILCSPTDGLALHALLENSP